MTTQMDSETPSCHPFSCMMATTLMTMPDTQVIDMILYVKFWVAIRRIINANNIDIKMPCIAPSLNALSLGMKIQPGVQF
jgi:hypothetical protein